MRAQLDHSARLGVDGERIETRMGFEDAWRVKKSQKFLKNLTFSLGVDIKTCGL